MPGENSPDLTSFNGWTLRIRPSASSSPRLLVLLHGWTGDENSMWVFTRGLSPDYWIVAPRAPHPAEPRGYTWRPLQPGTFGWPSLETLAPAGEELVRMIDGYSTSIGLNADELDLMGFSQGAAMVNLLGLLHPERVRRMCVLAGFVPSGLERIIARRPLEGKSVFVAHGARDEMVPIERARASIELLESAGARVIYCEENVGHKLSAACLHALEDYLKD